MAPSGSKFNLTRRIPDHGTFSKYATSILTFLRALAAAIVFIGFSPILLPLIAKPWNFQLPCTLERVAILFLSLTSYLAGFQVSFGSRTPIQCNELHAPLLRSWISPLVGAGAGRILTFERPGLWMSEEQLNKMNHWLKNIAGSSMEHGRIPSHILFSGKRSALRNRIVSFAFYGDIPVGFTAMVYLPVDGHPILHLGLTMINKSARRNRLQSRLFQRALAMSLFNTARTKCTITNIAASPAGIGSASDYFFNTFPHYKETIQRSDWHLKVARHILSRYRHEFGCSADAKFNEKTFVVHASNNKEGGGTSEFIRENGKPVSHYKDPACDKFVERSLDLAAGDELFQVGTVDLCGTYLKYIFSVSQ